MRNTANNTQFFFLSLSLVLRCKKNFRIYIVFFSDDQYNSTGKLRLEKKTNSKLL